MTELLFYFNGNVWPVFKRSGKAPLPGRAWNDGNPNQQSTCNWRLHLKGGRRECRKESEKWLEEGKKQELKRMWFIHQSCVKTNRRFWDCDKHTWHHLIRYALYLAPSVEEYRLTIIGLIKNFHSLCLELGWGFYWWLNQTIYYGEYGIM